MDLFNGVIGATEESKGSNHCPMEEQAKGTRLGGGSEGNG